MEVATIGNTMLVFVSGERPGVIMVYAIDSTKTPPAPTFVTMITDIPINETKTWDTVYNERLASMLDPEDIM